MRRLSPLLFLIGCISAWLVYAEVYTAEAQKVPELAFVVEKGESAKALSERLADEQVIRSALFFRTLLAVKNLDTGIHAGRYTVYSPITMARVVSALEQPESSAERTVTIIPGWDLRDIAEYFEHEGILGAEEFYKTIGAPAVQYGALGSPENIGNDLLKEKPRSVSLEGYLAPETIRVYETASGEEILRKFVEVRKRQFTPQMMRDIHAGGRTVHEVLTIASIVEREVASGPDRPKVADLFWRRYDADWGLQADSTVHYAVGKKGNVFTTASDRGTDSAWNTYKYAGLPPGPIASPSIESIMAAIYPEKNDYWYFLTTLDGEVKYGRTHEEHEINRVRYLRS